MKEIAKIDHAEFSNVGMIHTSTSDRLAYRARVSPEDLETNRAYIFMPLELPATVNIFMVHENKIPVHFTS